MSDSAQTRDSAPTTGGLSAEQLAGEQVQDLPDREAMSLLDVGGLSGLLPVPIDPEAPVSLPDPSTLPSIPAGLPADVDLSNVDGNVGDISDVTDVSDILTVGGTAEVADLQGAAGASVDAGAPAGLMQPADPASSPLA